MAAVILPLAAVCVFCVVNVMLCLRTGTDRSLIALLLTIVGGCVLAGMICGFVCAYFTEKLIRRHSRYTFFDILPRGMVFSLYSGEYHRFGRRVIQRRLYYIPFAEYKGAFRDAKKHPDRIKFTGEIREYLLETKRLGYHVDEEGYLRFDSPELDERGYSLTDSVEIRGRFGSTKQLEKSVGYYYEQFRNIPEKKAFNISEYIPAHRKPKPTTSNPALELPSFDRKW